jgi:hypothetical protein
MATTNWKTSQWNGRLYNKLHSNKHRIRCHDFYLYTKSQMFHTGVTCPELRKNALLISQSYWNNFALYTIKYLIVLYNCWCGNFSATYIWNRLSHLHPNPWPILLKWENFLQSSEMSCVTLLHTTEIDSCFIDGLTDHLHSIVVFMTLTFV